jgi:CAAX amino terminal protease family.
MFFCIETAAYSVFIVLVSNRTFVASITSIIGNRYWGIRICCFTMTILMLLLLFLFLRLEKKKNVLSSIGLSRTNVIKSSIIGLCISVPFIILKIVLVYFKRDSSDTLNIQEFMYYLFCVGLVEEVIYRGYLQSRIEVLFRKKWVSVLCCGILFYIAHISHDVINGQITIGSVLLRLMLLLVMHIVFLFIYKRGSFKSPGDRDLMKNGGILL